tara:strand:+ start:3657 stop:4811 length:1155 start_codon:yes stop_codon:yes gene_type:complete
MVQLVFVHGVSVRKGSDYGRYETSVASRHDAFKKYCFQSHTVEFHEPYWGEHGATLALDGISIPTSRSQSSSLSLSDEQSKSLELNEDSHILLQAAKTDFEAVLSAITELLSSQNSELCNDELANHLSDYLVRREDETGKIVTPEWLQESEISNDIAFIERLRRELPVSDEKTALGLFDPLKAAGSRILGATVKLVDGPIEKLVKKATPNLAIFIGDAFVYLKNGSQRDRIRSTVRTSLLRAAHNAKKTGEKLIVIGHSMGANILYDMLSDTEYTDDIESELGGRFNIDLFLSVGTQVGLFQELSLFENSQFGVTDCPNKISNWWHVYNKMDVLSFATSGIFQNVKEFHIDTRANIIDAHTAYFTSPIFHKKLRKRLISSGMID